MDFILAGVVGVALSIMNMIRTRPRVIPVSLYWLHIVLAFCSSVYFLWVIYNGIEDFAYGWFALSYFPSMYFGMYVSHCWYKERGKKRPWWGI